MRIRSSWVRAATAATLALALSGIAFGATARQAGVYKLPLEGAQEVPAADPDGMGFANVAIDVAASEVCFDIKVKDVGTVNRGHIHRAAAGVNGGIVIPFFELRTPPADPGAPASDPRNDQLESKGTISGCVTADPVLLQDIIDHPADYYVNVHNARFPGGALRCQIDR
jgi:CHRD domain-containing protein